MRPAKLHASCRLELRAPGAGARAPRVETHPRPGRAEAARPIELPRMCGASKAGIRRLVSRSVVVFLCDDSGSMYGAWGDPSGIRYAVCLSVISLLRRAGGGKAGVIHWGTEAPPHLALSPVDVKRGLRALAATLTVPRSLGGTELTCALHAARQMADDLADENDAIFFVLSDGIETVSDATHAAVNGLPKGAVHMLLVDRAGGCNDSFEQAWRTVRFGSFNRLDTFDTRVMSHQVAEIFARSIGLEMPYARYPETKGRRS